MLFEYVNTVGLKRQKNQLKKLSKMGFVGYPIGGLKASMVCLIRENGVIGRLVEMVNCVVVCSWRGGKVVFLARNHQQYQRHQ